MATSFSRQLHSQESQEGVVRAQLLDRRSGHESSKGANVQQNCRDGNGEGAFVVNGAEEDKTEDKHHEAASMELPAENSPPHLHLKTETNHHASLGNTINNLQLLAFPTFATVPTHADISAVPNANGSVPMLPSKEVEGALQSCLTSAEIQVKQLLQQAMDSVQSQVLRALHQAASDIGKEAAHRVLIAERKADLLELELSNIKQQALSMLLHLKADSAAQALELDKKYIAERRRAQDAEAKLAVANDNLKRLKSELKRKGDILNKMQKLVQPETDDKFSGGTEIVQDSSRSVSTDMHRKSPQSRNLCVVEHASFFGCNRMPHQGTHSSATQLTKPALQSSANLNENINVSEDTFVARKGFLELHRQTSSSSGTFRDYHFSPSLQKEDPPAENLGKEETDHSRKQDMTVVDLPAQEENPLPARLLESYAGIDRSQAEQMHDGQLPLDTTILDGKGVPEMLNTQGNVKDEHPGSLKSPNATVKGFYVRRKVRENGKLSERKGSNLAMGKPNLNNVDDQPNLQSNAGAFGTLSHESALDLHTSDLRRCPEGQINVTSSDCLLAHAQCPGEPLPLSLDESSIVDRLDETKIVSANNNFNINSSNIEALDFARPDYEVATSLAELAAVSGLKVRTQQQEEAPLAASGKGDHFLRPGKTGLRMKRKGISIDKKAVLDVESKATKKLRPNHKLVTGLKDGNRVRGSRRNRGNKYTSSNACLSLESSRDSRRLMQGARQLLCLAEKKW